MRKFLSQSTTPANESGFTLVELMVATLVFSTVLVVMTFGVMHFTNSYYGGINASATQNAAQAALNSVTQVVQFSSTDPTATDGTEGFFCAGTKLYVYDIGKIYQGSPATSAGLYQMDRMGTNCAARAPSGGLELLGKNMRLTDIQFSRITSNTLTAGGIWQLSLEVAYGDGDLLCRSSIAGLSTGSCQASASSYTLTQPIVGNDVRCKQEAGSQFCSVAGMATTAQQRIAN